MDGREFAEWIAFAALEPFGSIRDDQRAGIIASAFVNIHKKRGSTPTNWNDFLPTYDDLNPSTDWEDLLKAVEAINAMLGGVDKRKTKPAPDT